MQKKEFKLTVVLKLIIFNTLVIYKTMRTRGIGKVFEGLPNRPI